ncbi:MAG: glycosyltransferase family 2 protein, partial [Planctomycetota bacterium]
MIHIPSKTDPTRGPLVSYIIPTYNRPKYLSTAIASALAQEYHNLQVIVVRDGGEDVKDVIDQFADDRLEYIDRAENWGKCRSLNQAIEHVRGKYVLYLDDDDLHYSNHVSSLVECLEGPTDCQAAYSDLNCSLVQLDANNNRKVLGKSVVVSRDYDPFFLLKYNTAPHGSTMHRTDLFEKTGLYNP